MFKSKFKCNECINPCKVTISHEQEQNDFLSDLVCVLNINDPKWELVRIIESY